MSSRISNLSAGVAPGYNALLVGDLAPWFRQRCIGQEGLFSFDMAAGRFVALCFYGAASDPLAGRAIEAMKIARGMSEPGDLALFGVSNDAADGSETSLAPRAGLRHFDDADGAVSRAYGVAPTDGPAGLERLRRGWFILDPRLRLIAGFPLGEAGDAAALGFLRSLPPPAVYGREAQAPVLVIPYVFEPQFCARLIAVHQNAGGVDSGVLTDGAVITDHGFKRRTDCRILDKALVGQVQTRIFRRVVPEIRHAFQFNATRLERLIVAAYDAAEAGRFGPHRDNTVAATAHRRFAVSINLNDDFEGGDITFPEYSARAFRPAKGGAVVFSCSLLHAVIPMARGTRYACLPFVYDDAAAELRRERRDAGPGFNHLSSKV